VNERALLEAFEAGTVEPQTFGHRDHLRVAWALLAQERVGFAEAYRRLREGLIDICARAGKPDRYSETQTLGWLALVHAAIATAPQAEVFEAVEAAAGGALGRDGLSRLYPPGVLGSAASRTGLILPDNDARAAS
jgi:hypothetical protein